jgi:hypothetical protein
MNYYILNYDIILNLKTNIIKNIFFSSIGNYKCESCIKDKYKFLYYKNDKLARIDNFNFIYYDFSYTKYFSKKHYEYVISEKANSKANSKANKKANSIEEKLCAYTIIKYYKCFKYIYTKTNSFKYKYVQIFIMNKYELNYFNKFFNLFFVVLCFSLFFFVVFFVLCFSLFFFILCCSLFFCVIYL